jgi:transposase
MQERRRRAARLFAAGKRSQAEIARELHIGRQSVSRWFEAWQHDTPDWIRGAGRAGRRPQLDGAQLKQVDEALRQGAQAHGFGTDLWTLPRAAEVIERVMGVNLSSRSCLEDTCRHGVEPATASQAGAATQ